MDTSLIVSEMQKKAAGVAPIGSTLKFDMGGEYIYIDGNNGNAVTAENKDADCTITVDKDDFIALTNGDLNPMMAFMGGKIKVDGDMSVAMKLQSLL
ncbi:MAG: SCP2 sterol-binding domain-containing protein [Bacteroidota bacterium]